MKKHLKTGAFKEAKSGDGSFESCMKKIVTSTLVVGVLLGSTQAFAKTCTPQIGTHNQATFHSQIYSDCYTSNGSNLWGSVRNFVSV